MAVGSHSTCSFNQHGTLGSIPGGCPGYFFSLSVVDGMKNLWCSITAWLLSTHTHTHTHTHMIMNGRVIALMHVVKNYKSELIKFVGKGMTREC